MSAARLSRSTRCGRGWSRGPRIGAGRARSAHLEGRDDALVSVGPLIECCGGRFAVLLDAPVSGRTLSALRAAETIGRPLGSPAFLDFIAGATGRDPRPKRRGPKPQQLGARVARTRSIHYR